MTVDPGRLRHAILLATGEQPASGEVEPLADRLCLAEEVLPYLLLRRDGFAGCERIKAALAEAVARSPAPPRSLRPPGLAGAANAASAAADLKSALKAVIEHDLASAEIHRHLDAAVRRAVELSPAEGFDAHLRVRID